MFLIYELIINQQPIIISLTILLISSGSASHDNPCTAKKIINLSTDNVQQPKSPLSGVHVDKLHLRQMHSKYSWQEDQLKIIESSKYNKLLSMKQIKQKLKEYFHYGYEGATFYFSGHGYPDGAMCIQTLQHPDGQPLTLQEVYDIAWGKQAQGYKRGTYFYLDCCYSGKMAARLKNNRKAPKVGGDGDGICQARVYCSSGPNHISYDSKRYGGLLICRQWSFHFKDYLLPIQKKELKIQFEHNLPVYLQGQCRKWSQLELMKWEH